MRVPSGSTDRKMSFIAVDATDRVTRETGKVAGDFTVYRSRDGGTPTAYTTPTIAEASSTNMPGLYWLTIDEDTTLSAGHDEEEYVVRITATGVAPIERTLTIFRPKLTEGQTVTAANGAANANLDLIKTQSVTCAAGVTVLASVGTAATSTAQTGDCFARLGAPAGASVSADIAAAKTVVDAIKVKSDFLPSATAGAAGGLFIAGTNAATIITGSLTTTFSGNLTGSVGSVATGGITTSSFAAGAINAAAIATDAIDSDALAASAVTEIWAASTVATAAAIADAVWDEAISGHLTGGTTGAALNAAGSAGDPWSTPLPGAYGAGTAGKIIGDNINATISSRMATFSLPSNFSSLTITPAGIVDADIETIKGQTVTCAGGVTVPTGTLASTTNIAAGTLTTVTNLTNLPTMPTDWITNTGLSAGAVTEIQTGLALEATLTAIAGYLDTEIASILADTNELQTDWANGGRLDLLLDTAAAGGGGGGDATAANQITIINHLTAIKGAGWVASDNLHTIASAGGSLTVSQDEKLTAIYTATQAGPITMATTQPNAATLVIHRGRSYQSGSGQARLNWTVDSTIDLSDAGAEIYLALGPEDGAATVRVPADEVEVITPGTRYKVHVPLTGADSLLLSTKKLPAQKFELQAKLGAVTDILAGGDLAVRDYIEESSPLD